MTKSWAAWIALAVCLSTATPGYTAIDSKGQWHMAPVAEPPIHKEYRDPSLAAGLTIGVPIALIGLSYGAFQLGAQGNQFYTAMAVMGLTPFALTTGYYYAGEPEQAAQVAWHGYAWEAAGALAGYLLFGMLGGGGEGSGYAAFAGMFIGPVISLIPYSLWTTWDVFHTTVHNNETATASSSVKVQ